MTKSKTERIESITEQIRQLESLKKELIQKQKAEDIRNRTHRLCRRHGQLEGFMPDLVTITDEQYEEFIKTGVDTRYGRKRLAEIIGKGASTPAVVEADTAEAGDTKVVEATETTDTSTEDGDESTSEAEQSVA
jgi:hypothetical protein